MKRITPSAGGWETGRGYRKQLLLGPGALAAPGSLVQVVEIQPGDRIPAHVHRETREFYCVLAGRCRLTVGVETGHLQAGDMLLMEPGDVHHLENVGDSPFRLLVVKTNARPNDTLWEPGTANPARSAGDLASMTAAPQVPREEANGQQPE